jgi:hypothetical protein
VGHQGGRGRAPVTEAVADADLGRPTPTTWRPRARRWGSALFPEAPTTDRLTVWSVMVAAVGVGAATAASLLRQGGVPAWDTIWAEDGSASLDGALNLAFLDALRTPVSGYYQTLPRLLVEPVTHLPASWAAAALAVEAAGVTAIFALIVYVASGAHLRTPLARLAAAAVAVVTPVGMVDVPNSLCNLHWPGLYALFWVLLWVPRGRIGKVVGLAVPVVMGATNIMALVLVPLAVARVLFGPRGWYGRALAVSLGVGLLPQVVGLFTGVASARSIASHPEFFTPLRYFFDHTVPAAILGEVVLPGGLVRPPGQWLVILMVWAVLIAAVALAPWLARPNWPVAALLGVHALVFWMVAAGSTGLLASRYETTVVMFTVAALVAVLLPDVTGARGAPLMALSLVLAVAWTANYRSEFAARGNGPRWSTAIAQARVECAKPGVASVAVPIAPQYPGVAWQVSLPCSYVR